MASSRPARAARDLPRDDRNTSTADLLHRASLVDTPVARRVLLDQVILENLCVARSIASGYRFRGIALEDLEQVACAALVRAVQHFDAECGGEFMSYAVPCIRGEIRRHFRDHGWVVRPPRRIQELQPRVLEERERLSLRNGGQQPSVDEIAAGLSESVSDVSEALSANGCFAPTSLDLPISEDLGTVLGDLLPDSGNESAIDAAEARLIVWPLIRGLAKHDRKLLRMRFFDELTQQQIADELGVTQTQVSRLLKRIMADLRDDLRDDPQPVTS